jgi:subtilisin family serine protease
MKFYLSLVFLLASPSIFASPIKIAVIDSGFQKEYLNQIPVCDTGGYDYVENSGFVTADDNGHGTNVTLTINAQIKQSRSEYCFMLYRVFSKKKNAATPVAMAQAAMDGADIINMSFTGNEYMRTEEDVIKVVTNEKIRFVVAAGNEGQNLDLECHIFPACIKNKLKNKNNFIVVSSSASTSNYGFIVDLYEEHCSDQPPRKMCGTSMATAYTTGKFVNFWIEERNKQKNVCLITDGQ